MSSLLGGWQWGIRVTPILGAVALLLVIFIMKEPKRGAAEKAIGATGATDIEITSYWKDIKAICQMLVNYCIRLSTVITIFWWVL